jgi:hypothetical protein
MPLKNISPSAYRVWKRNRDEFYLSYLAPHRMVRSAQMQAAAIGSAFDARVKSNLARDLFGDASKDSLAFEPLFEAQVDAPHRDWALAASEYVFHCYALSGRYDELLAMLERAAKEPSFEGKVYREIEGVPLMGMPDCTFLTYGGYMVILDWKVRGFCGKRTTSPTKHYISCRDGFFPYSKKHGLAHKQVKLAVVDNVPHHEGWMEEASKDYALQLAIYLWVKGEVPTDEHHFVMIDELACKGKSENYPTIRIAALSSRVSAAFQRSLLDDLKAMWTAIQQEHVFTDRSLEDSQVHAKELDAISLSQTGKGTSKDLEFGEFVRSQFRYY